MTATAISLRGVSKTFYKRRSLVDVVRRTPVSGVTAVNGVSFDVKPGKTFALVGESGSGKSTIAQLVVGLQQADAGDLLIKDQSMLSGRTVGLDMARTIQMVFQDPYTSLNPRWQVGAVISEPCRALRLGLSEPEIRDRVADLLTKVGLHPSDAGRSAHELSGGQRQRIAIARMLAAQAEIVVCDEPTSALDVSVQAQILNLMRDLQDEFGLTYLFISHNMSVVRFMADDVGVMKQGRLVEQGPAEQVFSAPADPYTRALLAAVPRPEPEAVH
ncbi:MAG: ABC transporter ATP-binding protein [Rhodobacteraceae bacterium]|nr:ABC transporter ATP-binding protein [Paracoccaceae bacterium]